MAIILNSPAFQQNDHIPSKYTCEGEDISPPLTLGTPSHVRHRRVDGNGGGEHDFRSDHLKGLDRWGIQSSR